MEGIGEEDWMSGDFTSSLLAGSWNPEAISWGGTHLDRYPDSFFSFSMIKFDEGWSIAGFPSPPLPSAADCLAVESESWAGMELRLDIMFSELCPARFGEWDCDIFVGVVVVRSKARGLAEVVHVQVGNQGKRLYQARSSLFLL